MMMRLDQAQDSATKYWRRCIVNLHLVFHCDAVDSNQAQEAATMYDNKLARQHQHSSYNTVKSFGAVSLKMEKAGYQIERPGKSPQLKGLNFRLYTMIGSRHDHDFAVAVWDHKFV